MTRILLSVAALALVIASGAVAQGRRPDKQKMELARELHGQLSTYASEKVLPMLRRWKAQLDGAMTADDLAALNDLRSRAKKLRATLVEHGKGLRAAWKSEDYDALRQHREGMKGMKDELHAILSELKPLAEKYRPTLEAIGAEAQPMIQEWRTEGKAIIEKWAVDHRDELGDHPRHLMKHGMSMGPMLGGSKKKAVAHFMLWSGEDLPGMQSSPDEGGRLPMMSDEDLVNLD